jgi:hypothetical protein
MKAMNSSIDENLYNSWIGIRSSLIMKQLGVSHPQETSCREKHGKRGEKATLSVIHFGVVVSSVTLCEPKEEST